MGAYRSEGLVNLIGIDLAPVIHHAIVYLAITLCSSIDKFDICYSDKVHMVHNVK